MADTKTFVIGVNNKHITAQPKHFNAPDNTFLQSEKNWRHPASAMINALSEKDDNINVIIMTSADEAVCSNLEAEINVAAAPGCHISIRRVHTDNLDDAANAIEIFEKVLDYIEDDSLVYSCSAYMSKPEHEIALLAIRSAYRLKYNDCFRAIVDVKGDDLHDMSALVQLDELARMMSRRKDGLNAFKKVMHGDI